MPVQPVNTNIPAQEPSAPPPPGTEGTATGGAAKAKSLEETSGTAQPQAETPPAPSDSFGKSKGTGQKAASWDANDKTGNSVVDNVLGKVAAANAGRPEVLAALSAAADDIKANFQQFCPPGGDVNIGAIISTVAAHAVGPITIPGTEVLNAESGANAGAGGGGGPGVSESGANAGASGGGPGVTETGANSGAGGGAPVSETGANSGAGGGSGVPESGANAGSSGVHIQGSSQTFPHLGSLGEGDIMALCFIVMMEAAKSAQQDLKSIMDGVKLINKQKDGLRKVQDQINKLAAANAGGNDGDAAKGLGSPPAGGDTKLGGWEVNGNPQTISFGAPGPDGEVAAGAFSYTTGVDGGVLTVGDINTLKDQIKNQLDSKSELGETESLRLQMAMDRVSKFMTALSNIQKKASDTGSAIIQNMK